MRTFATIEAFAAERRRDQSNLEKELFPIVNEAVDRFPAQGWYDDLLREVARAYVDTYHREGGQGQPQPPATAFVRDVRDTLDKTENPTDATPERISTWLATAILNAATQAAAEADEEFVVLEWVTMHDQAVREAHEHTEGQTRPPGEPYDVDGFPMRYPGDPLAPIELWINCRCSLAPMLGSEATRFSPTEPDTVGDAMTATTEAEPEAIEVSSVEPLTWYGILAPEGVWSGDKRRFADGSLRWRDLPLPLTWQRESDDGHKGSVVVAKIESIERVDGMMRGGGTFLQTPEADEAIGLLAEFGRFGVSIDADDAEFEYSEHEADKQPEITFTSARISSASIVPIPAFAEAFISLGTWADGEMPPCDPDDPDCEEQPTAPAPYALVEFVSDKPWSDFSESDYTPQQWKAACCLHRSQELEPKSNHGLPIKEPGGALNRNGVHAAAARFNQTSGPAEAKSAAKACLRSAYKQLGEEVPDVLKASVDLPEQFRRGPGWVTHPRETRRIHNYWTQPGQPGYQKINWGTPGDFNRCRALVGEKIATNSPEDVRYLNQICAQWHHDAIGYWPGRAPTEQRSADPAEFAATSVALGLSPTLLDPEPGPAISLVASGWCAPSDWFKDPELAALTPLTVTDDGRVFGHLAGWSSCHVGYEDVCVSPPHSASDYAYFLTGEVITTDGPVPVGQITLGGGHAAPALRPRAAIAHYDSTSAAVADVTCGEDEHGIWVAGAMRPGVSDEQVAVLRASPLSGDWRRIAGGMELIAALAVNSQGFPVPRVGVHAARQTSLVAAGAVQTGVQIGEFDMEAFADKVALALEARQARRNRMAAIAARIGGDGGL